MSNFGYVSRAGAYRHVQKNRAKTSKGRSTTSTSVSNKTAEHLKGLCQAAFDGKLQALQTFFGKVDLNLRCNHWKDSPTALWLAASEGHVEVITELLNNGAKLDSGTDSSSPLLIACTKLHFEAIKVLVTRGANIEWQGSHKVTPLHEVVRTRKSSVDLEGRIAIFEYLISKNAQLKTSDVNGRSFLISALIWNKGMIPTLLRHGCQPNDRGSWKSFPLFQAAKSHDKDSVKVLLDAGADVSKSSPSSPVSPLHIVVRGGNREMAELLLEYNANLQDGLGVCGTPLDYAVAMKRKDMTEFLISKGAQLNLELPIVGDDPFPQVKFKEEDHLGAGANLSPLMWAAITGNEEMCSLLLDSGAQIDLQNGFGLTALHYAVAGNRPKVAAFLVQQGATLSFPNPEHSLLYLAIQRDFDEMIRSLHELGVDLNSPIGSTSPLCRALDEKKFMSASTLLELGVSLGGPDDESLTHYLVSQKNEQALNFLLGFRDELADERGKRYQETLLHRAVIEHAKSIAVNLVDLRRAKKDLNVPNSRGETPVHSAASLPDTGLLKWLIRLNADLDPVDSEGNTPLLVSAKAGNWDGVDLLLDQKVDLYQKNSSGEDLMWLACLAGNFERVSVLQELQFDADTYQENAKSLTLNPEEINKLKRGLRLSAIEEVTKGLLAYNQVSTSRKVKSVDASRDTFIQAIRSALKTFKANDELELGDVLALVNQATQTIVDKKLHGRRGPSHSELYQQLNKSAEFVKNQFEAIKKILGTNLKDVWSEVIKANPTISFEEFYSPTTEK